MSDYREVDGIAVFGRHEESTLQQMREVARHAGRSALMADAHHGYVMPVGGVAAYEDQVSVLGVGVDIACVAVGSPVLTVDGRALPIERVPAGDAAACWDGAATRAVEPCLGAVPRGTRPVLRLALANGRALRVTADHRLRTPDGWREAGTLRRGDRIACVVARGLPDEPPPAAPLPVVIDDAHARDVLRERGWLPLRPTDARCPALLRLLGYVSGDGHLSRDGKYVSAWTTTPADAEALLADFARIDFPATLFRRRRNERHREELHVRVASTALHALLAALGSPVGKKRWPAHSMPWLDGLPAWQRAQFLSGFFSAEMMTPRLHANGVIPNLQVKQAGEDAHAIDLVDRMLGSLGFRTSVAPSGPARGTRQTWVLQVLGGAAAQLRIAEEIGFCHAPGKRAAAARVASVAWEHATLVRTREAARAEARARHGAGESWRTVMADVADRPRVEQGFVYHAMYDRRGLSRHPGGAAPEPRCQGEACWVRVDVIEEDGTAPVYDVVTGDPATSFLVDGIVVHNCGNAAIRTNQTLSDLDANPNARGEALAHLADEIAATVSFGMGRSNRADDAPTDDPLFTDAAWRAVPGSKKEVHALKEKARRQLGTVGGGNHYVDVFADETDTLWVGVHFGSRGLGHTIAQGFSALGQGRKWGERVGEREVLLPLGTPLGDDYWELMTLAGRYAYAGREWVARKVVELMGATEMELVHNHHNYCIPADSLVPTTRGPKRMADIRPGDEVYAFDPERGVVASAVAAHWQTGIRRTCVIRTAGRRLTVTEDHPVLVVEVRQEAHPTRPWHARRAGALRFKPAGEIAPGDIVVCADGYYPTTDPAGEELARLAGAMLGDGWIRHEPSVRGSTVGLAIGTGEESHTARDQELLTRVLPAADWKSNARGTSGLTCSSVDVPREVVRLGLGGYSPEKRVPRWAFAMPVEEKLALLAGYLDADGFVADERTSNHGRATIASTDRRLVEELRELAIGCGLRVTPVRAERVTTNFGPATLHRCVLSADSAARLDLWHEKKSGRRHGTRHSRPQALAPGKIGYSRLPPGVFAQRVTAVERSAVAEPVYDLTVEHPSHAFVCEGVVVHNCWRETHDGRDLLVVRKGATPAFPGQLGFVGGSMGDDAVIVRGAAGTKGDTADAQRAALFSTVHGAGRVLSRTAAAGKRDRKTGRILKPGAITPAMMDAWIAERHVILRGGGLDESPQAYRRLPDVLAAQGGTIEILHTLRPLVVAMAGADEIDPYKD